MPRTAAPRGDSTILRLRRLRQRFGHRFSQWQRAAGVPRRHERRLAQRPPNGGGGAIVLGRRYGIEFLGSGGATGG